MKGRNGTTSFLPSKGKGGFQREISDQCLTKEQTRQLYDKIEIGKMVNTRKLDWCVFPSHKGKLRLQMM